MVIDVGVFFRYSVLCAHILHFNQDLQYFRSALFKIDVMI